MNPPTPKKPDKTEINLQIIKAYSETLYGAAVCFCGTLFDWF